MLDLVRATSPAMVFCPSKSHFKFSSRPTHKKTSTWARQRASWKHGSTRWLDVASLHSERSHCLLHEVSPDLRRITGLVHRLDKLPDDILVTIPLILRGQLHITMSCRFSIQERALHVHHHELVVTTSFGCGVQGILSRTETKRSC